MNKKLVKNLVIYPTVGFTILFITALIYIKTQDNRWPYRIALPDNAKNINEWSQTEPFMPDFLYMMKAEIGEDDFKNYVTYFKMSKIEDESFSWDTRSRQKWWNPVEYDKSTYHYESGHFKHYSKYENGYIYVYALEH